MPVHNTNPLPPYSGRHFAESVSNLHNTAHLLSTRPELSPVFRLRLYPLTLERSALLAQYEVEERYSIECAQVAYDEERERVEDEWRRGRERVRERLLEGIEERRRRAREEKEGDGTVGGQFSCPASPNVLKPPRRRNTRHPLAAADAEVTQQNRYLAAAHTTRRAPGRCTPAQQHNLLGVSRKRQRHPLVEFADHDRPLPQSTLPFRRRSALTLPPPTDVHPTRIVERRE